jgi:hypothetical protein
VELGNQLHGYSVYRSTLLFVHDRKNLQPKVVNWEIHYNETGEQTATLLERSVWAEKYLKKDVVLHFNNGSPIKSLTMRKVLHQTKK